MDVQRVLLIKTQNPKGLVFAVLVTGHDHVCSDLKYRSETQHHFRIRICMGTLGSKQVKARKSLFELDFDVTPRRRNEVELLSSF